MSQPQPQTQRVFPTQERIQQEIAVALSIIEQYGTNQPGKTYEDGVADALMWALGGPEPQTVEDNQMDLNTLDKDVLQQWVAGQVQAQRVCENWHEMPLHDDEYENDLLMKICGESPTFANLVRSSLHYLDTGEDNHLPTWLGSYIADRPKTQVQLIVTQDPDYTIDED